MQNIIDYIHRPAVFEPEAVMAMSQAYDLALASFVSPPPKAVIDVIAARIIQLARKGERNPQVLCQISLSAIPDNPFHEHPPSKPSTFNQGASR
jgi:hypothetical protein